MEQLLTLYLDLKPGTKPDLATVARAALAFDSTVKEVAFIIDPTLSVRLELKSGTEGSLKLNSLIKAVKDRADRKTLLTIALVVLGWFASDVRSLITQEALLALIRSEDDQHLTEEEVNRVAVAVVKALEGKVAKQEAGRIYEELQKDENITGVGVTTNPNKKPRFIVPHYEFSTRSGTVSKLLEADDKRIRTLDETVTLISPVLLQGGRRWRFSAGGFEFGASMKDEEFLSRLLSGKEPVAMVAGITMVVKLEVREEKVAGVWVTKERNILKVYNTNALPVQRRLPLTPPDK